MLEQAAGRISRASNDLPNHLPGRYDRDRIPARARPQELISSSNLNIPDNLIVKAADSVLQATGCHGPDSVRFEKADSPGRRAGRRIQQRGRGTAGAAGPAQNGRLPMEKLLELAARTGQRRTVLPARRYRGRHWGAGPNCIRFPMLPSLSALLITPGVHVSTPEAYQALGRNYCSAELLRDIRCQGFRSALPGGSAALIPR